jgi:hypothetical protein
MAWTFNGTGSQVRVPDGSHLDIPNGDWSYVGWFRVSDNSDSNYKRILAWGTAGATPHVQVFIPGTGLGVTNNDHLSARVIGTGGADTAVLFPSGFAISSHYDEWIAWTLTHENATNTTYLKILDRGAHTIYSDSAVLGLGTMNIAEDLYVGGNNSGTDAARFVGDMAHVAFLPGLYMDNHQFHGFIHGGQPYRYPECTLHIPMFGDREEIWTPGTGAPITPNTVNISTATYDGPQMQMITPRREDAMEETDPVPVRVSRQFSEAMVTETPDVRVSQQFLMVLQSDQPVLNESASSTISFVQTVTTPLTYVSANNALGLTDTAVGVRDLPVSVSSTLTLSSLGGRVRSGDLTSTMFMTSLAGYFNLVNDRQPVGHTLNLVQTVTSLSSLDVPQDLGLTQTVNILFPIKPNVVQIMSLVSHTSTPHRAFITDTMNINGFLNTPLPTQVVTDTMNLVQTQASFDDILTTMNLTQNVVVAFSLTAANTMNLVDTMTMIAIWNREVEHSDVLGHALTWYEDTPCGKKQYTPFQGENTVTSDVEAPRNDLQDPQGDTGNFSVYTPYLGVPTSEVVLRNPEMDNRDRNAYTRVSEETRGGKLVVYSDPDWPKVRTLAVTFVGLTETKVDELQTFMQATVGQQIGLTDWEGRLWQGFITNPNEGATEDGKRGWTVSFQFEGEMLEVEQPGNDDGNGMAMNLSQSVTAVIV